MHALGTVFKFGLRTGSAKHARGQEGAVQGRKASEAEEAWLGGDLTLTQEERGLRPVAEPVSTQAQRRALRTLREVFQACQEDVARG